MRAILYVRNSSGKQVAAGTHDGLLASGHETAQRMGAEVVAVYADKGCSAKSGKLGARGDFARLVDDLPSLKPNVCIVANVDRLTRTGLWRELGAIWAPFQEHGVRVATADGKVFNLDDAGDNLIAFIDSWRSAQENAARAERTRTGRKRAASEGRAPGRYPFGYRCVKGNWTTPGGDVVRGIYEGAAAGEPCARIAGRLNAEGIASARGRKWTQSTIADIIRPRRPNGDPYVTGLWVGQAGTAPIAVPTIVTADLAARARASFASRAHSPPPSTRFVQLLDLGACRCALCGGAIRVVQCRGRLRADGTRARFAYYSCEGRVRARETGADPCPLRPRRIDAVDAAVWRVIVGLGDRPRLVAGAAETSTERTAGTPHDLLSKARAKLVEEQGRLDALAEALGAGALTADKYREQVARVTGRQGELRESIAAWESETPTAPDPTAAELAVLRMEIRRLAAEGTPDERRALVRRLFPLWRMDDFGVEPIRSGERIGEKKAGPESIGRIAV